MSTLDFLRVNESLINNSFEVAVVVAVVVAVLFIYEVMKLSSKGKKTAKKESLKDFLIF